MLHFFEKPRNHGKSPWLSGFSCFRGYQFCEFWLRFELILTYLHRKVQMKCKRKKQKNKGSHKAAAGTRKKHQKDAPALIKGVHVPPEGGKSARSCDPSSALKGRFMP